LIVTCEKCSTRFELDEARIPTTGAQLRCSRCKHSFFLAHPGVAPSDALHSIASETAADATAGVPGSTSDLDGPSEEEDDWQFSEEIRTVGDDEVDAEEDLDADADHIFDHGFDAASLEEPATPGDLELDDSFTEAAAPETAEVANQYELSDSGLELDGDDHPSATVEASASSPASSPEAEVESGHDDSSFGSVDDFTSWMEDDDSAPASPPPVRASSPAPVASAASPSASEDLEDPESWDLAPDSDFGAAAPGAAASLDAVLSGADSRARERGGIGTQDGHPAAYFDDLSEPSTLNQFLIRAGALVGWAVMIPVVAAVAFLAFQSEWTRWEPVHQTLVVGSLEAETTGTAWMETSRSGSLLVVEGVARNQGGEVLWLEGFQLVLLDEAGERIAAPAYAIGTPIPEETLRESALPHLEHAVEMAHKGLLANPLVPGEERPFQAIVTELPEGAERILLEIRKPAQGESV
jgi:predicted Zn finger-like uncharacterized protein